MKKNLLIILPLLLASMPVFGQRTGTNPVTTAAPVLNKAVEPFSREKFDPLRDPKADLASAVIEATNGNKRIILDVGGEWCVWCVYMDKFFYQNPDLDKLRKDNYVWVKVNMGPENENPAFLSPYPVPKGYPHLYVLDESGKLLHSQDTAPLEAGKGYDLAKFTAFLKEWKPKKIDVKP